MRLCLCDGQRHWVGIGLFEGLLGQGFLSGGFGGGFTRNSLGLGFCFCQGLCLFEGLLLSACLGLGLSTCPCFSLGTCLCLSLGACLSLGYPLRLRLSERLRLGLCKRLLQCADLTLEHLNFGIAQLRLIGSGERFLDQRAQNVLSHDTFFKPSVGGVDIVFSRLAQWRRSKISVCYFSLNMTVFNFTRDQQVTRGNVVCEHAGGRRGWRP